MGVKSTFAGSFALAILLAAVEQGCNAEVQTTTRGSGTASGATTGSGGSGGAGFGGDPSGTGAAGSTGSSTGGATATSGTGGEGGCAAITECHKGLVYKCGDGLDNDGDGLIDSDDPDCLGACDNTEDSFGPGFFQQSDPGCTVDCYFDADPGSGNDDCHWSHRCDPNEVSPGYHPESSEGSFCAYDPATQIPGTAATCADLQATQSPECHAYCGPLVPNGCDCFGCCELPAGSGKYAWIGSHDDGCTLASALDPSKCEPCAPVPGCLNACDACEICIGKATVAPGCAVQDQCAPGIQPCGLPGQGCCPSGNYCVTGCCQPVPT